MSTPAAPSPPAAPKPVRAFPRICVELDVTPRWYDWAHGNFEDGAAILTAIATCECSVRMICRDVQIGESGVRLILPLLAGQGTDGYEAERLTVTALLDALDTVHPRRARCTAARAKAEADRAAAAATAAEQAKVEAEAAAKRAAAETAATALAAEATAAEAAALEARTAAVAASAALAPPSAEAVPEAPVAESPVAVS